MARHLEIAIRQTDADTTIFLWQNAALPPFWQLASANKPPTEAVGATLAAYWLSHPERKARLDALCTRLAGGEEWTHSLFTEIVTGTKQDVFTADRAFDTWLLERRDTILTVGTTPHYLPARAWRMLFLHPGEDGVPAHIPPDSPLSALIDHRDQKWAKTCASSKHAKMLRLATGRDEKMLETAKAYAEFFAGFAKGEPALTLQGKLVRAELLLYKSGE